MIREYSPRRPFRIFYIAAAGLAVSALSFPMPAMASCSGLVCDSELAGAYVPPAANPAPTYSSHSSFFSSGSSYASSPAPSGHRVIYAAQPSSQAIISPSPVNYAPASYAAPSYGEPIYSTPSYYAQPEPRLVVASNTAHFEGDEVVTRAQIESFKPRRYYFEPSDYRSFKCRGKKCEFEFKGRTKKDARAVEVYLAEALTVAAGPAETYTNCAIKRRSDKVICKMRGDLSHLNTSVLRRELYGR